MSESPIFDAVQRDLAGQQAREFVRAGLAEHVGPLVRVTRKNFRYKVRLHWRCESCGGYGDLYVKSGDALAAMSRVGRHNCGGAA